MRLRPYQRECLERLLQRYKEGKRRLLVSLPTGTGKTVVFAQFPSFFAMKRRMLVLAHRQELLDQAAAKFQVVDPSLAVGVEQAGRRAPGARVVIASVPTLQGARLRALSPDEFYLIVVDEAHHAVANSYRAIFEHFQLFAPGTQRLLVGFTATPRRGDRRSLGAVFEEIAYSKSLEEMIQAGYLSRIAGWRIRSGVSLDGVKVRAGDFVESQLAHAVNVAERNDLLVSAYWKLARGRRCVVFCADVEHARTVARTFSAAGLRAEAVWGAMAREERRGVLERFHAGALDVVTNCNVLTEGFDEPAVACVLMARPTQSLLLYAQMVGRGTRLFEGKPDLLVIDVADNSRRHTLAGLQQLFDLPVSLEFNGADVMTTAREVRDIGRRMPWVDLSRVRTPEELKFCAERIEFFRFEPPEEIADATDFCWLGEPGGGYRLGLEAGDRIDVHATMLGSWEVRLHRRQAGWSEVLGQAGSPAEAVALADAYVLKQFPGARKLIDREASWRRLAPTEKQLRLLESRGLPVPERLTRGQAAWMLSYSLGRRGTVEA